MKRESKWKTARKTVAERFWPKVNKDGPVFQDLGPCWLWIGAKRDYGYGNFGITEDGRFRCVRAYAMSWQLAGRELPKKPYVLDHVCKNPPCVNPDHLRVVTQYFNCTDHSDSPHGLNKRKTHCTKCGTAYAGANLAIYPGLQHGKRKPARACLKCAPQYWMWAVIQRPGPPKAKTVWRGPFRDTE